ncbi:MAG: sigma-70 family RNA polymerase sigma factor [Phytoplasma sp.]|uniref:sigma-70 family RNA polymerase sigma factor n=1 Tax=Phytoplasma sp. TaxID=2155 RepID=UPI002B40D779|nr:sigma-70 family RNA polymerase sigma factor [Phytoplasma sp.]WRH06720.1 MAG: sigma-70 family RNA polymerase sigma factor [Phytoplasma sp.]
METKKEFIEITKEKKDYFLTKYFDLKKEYQDLYRDEIIKIRDQLYDFYSPWIREFVYKSFRFHPQTLTHDDLFQEGSMSFIYSLEKYNDFSINFDSYAFNNIKSSLREVIRKSYVPSISQNEYRDKSVKKHQNLTFEEDKEYFKNASFSKQLNPHQVYMKNLRKEILMVRIEKNLTQTEKKIMNLIYGLKNGIELSIEEVSKKFKIKKKLVYNFIENSKQKLRKFYKVQI